MSKSATTILMPGSFQCPFVSKLKVQHCCSRSGRYILVLVGLPKKSRKHQYPSIPQNSPNICIPKLRCILSTNDLLQARMAPLPRGRSRKFGYLGYIGRRGKFWRLHEFEKKKTVCGEGRNSLGNWVNSLQRKRMGGFEGCS